MHANDWQTALIPAYLAWMGANVPSLLTIHNLAYQGLFSPETLQRIGAPESAFQIDGVEFYGKVSFLKAGIYLRHPPDDGEQDLRARDHDARAGLRPRRACWPGARRKAASPAS